MGLTQPFLRLVRDDESPLLRGLIAGQVDVDAPRLDGRTPNRRPEADLDLTAELQAMRNEIATLSSELQNLRHEDAGRVQEISEISEELKLAARLQQDFLPKSLPQIGRVHFQTLFRPAEYVSGDFYDVIRLDETHVGFYIADAVGHGVPAALLTMFIKHALQTKQIEPGGYRLLSPVETLTRLNARLIEQNLSAATFATAVYGMINVETLAVQFAGAGHPHPVLLKADGTLLPLETSGGLLGIFADEPFDEQTATLSPGDKLVLFTDGVDVLFDDDHTTSTLRWREQLQAYRRLRGDQLTAAFADLIATRCGDELKDDITLLVLEVR